MSAMLKVWTQFPTSVTKFARSTRKRTHKPKSNSWSRSTISYPPTRKTMKTHSWTTKATTQSATSYPRTPSAFYAKTLLIGLKRREAWAREKAYQLCKSTIIVSLPMWETGKPRKPSTSANQFNLTPLPWSAEIFDGRRDAYWLFGSPNLYKKVPKLFIEYCLNLFLSLYVLTDSCWNFSLSFIIKARFLKIDHGAFRERYKK